MIDDEEIDDGEWELTLSPQDIAKLNDAKALIEDTEFYKLHAKHDPDYALYRAYWGIKLTLKEDWWGAA